MQIRPLATLAAAAVAMAVLALPVTAHAQAAARRTAGAPWVGLGIGVETGDLDGLHLRGDLEFPVQRLAPRLLLSGMGTVSYSHLSDRVFGVDENLNELALTPAARFTFEATPQLGLYGDAGIGLYYANLHVEGVGSDSDVGLLLRFGLGAFYEVSPTVRLGGELGFRPHFGDYNDTTTTLLFTAQFHL